MNTPKETQLGPVRSTKPADVAAYQAALEALAEAFDPGEYTTTLVTWRGRVHLAVSNKHVQLAENIYADHRCYWWAWSEPIGPVRDPSAAAAKVASVLRAAPEPSRG
jgi:hypothetical protein